MVKSLGGSETAALMLAQALGARGHDVKMFCNLPPAGAPDFVPQGYVEGGVTYLPVEEFGQYVNNVEHDLTIGVRAPQFMAFECKSKKKVLWAHDIFTKRGMGQAINEMGWCFDEIWTVSEWHRHQVNEATGYPLDHIVALRNGIVRYEDVETIDRGKKNIIYAARPERGLDNLIMPGGVMDCLPDYTLTVCMYEHFPEHMRAYYEQIMTRMKEMPNVNFVGSKPNHELRQMIADSAAYIYPTQFEETSCILARECIEQGTPFLTTSVGALSETLGDCGIYFEDWLHENNLVEPDRGTTGWCKLFAQFFRERMEDRVVIDATQDLMALRDDLYWDGVAEIVEEHATPKGPVQQTIGAAIIAMNNEDTILRCLNSLVGQVDEIHIALGPSTDDTDRIIHRFWKDHPEIKMVVMEAQKIEPYKFGFDDARNLSVSRLNTDWIFWIDTDEYLVGDLRKYARENCWESYMISQHHFTVEPRGQATQIDRPARLFRNKAGFVCRGHIHEHFEKMPEGGPGRSMFLPDVDIGHTGYVNEAVRKSRFDRNWPFLEWQHDEKDQRKIDHFLWLRDLIHRMRIEINKGNLKGAVALANEAESYYNEHYEDMAAFGPGIFMSLQYLAEAYKVLNKGIPIKVHMQLDNRNATFEGLFTSYEQLERVTAQMLKPEFIERGGRYY
jgi:glycosyltransferase involved in cell wall biosynthesis